MKKHIKLALSVVLGLSILSSMSQAQARVINIDTNQIIADATHIMSSPAAMKAWGKTTQHVLQKLNAVKQGKKTAASDFIKFFAFNYTWLAEKWLPIVQDFSSEILNTMSVDDILTSLGLNRSMLPLENKKQDITCDMAEAQRKDEVITGILSRSGNAVSGILVAFGIGLSSIKEFVCKRIKHAQPEQVQPETQVEKALRIALRKNLTLAQLYTLDAFSKTEAFTIVASSVNNIKTIFLDTFTEEDPKSLEVIVTHLRALQNFSIEQDTQTNLEIGALHPIISETVTE